MKDTNGDSRGRGSWRSNEPCGSLGGFDRVVEEHRNGHRADAADAFAAARTDVATAEAYVVLTFMVPNEEVPQAGQMPEDHDPVLS